jgi:hypothetical protein
VKRFRRAVDPRVVALLAGSSGERLLAWGELSDGTVAACTDLAIHYPAPGSEPGEPGAGTRVPWDLVVRGAWSEEFLDLVVQSSPGGPSRQVRLRFEAPGNVPAVVKERVQWTVVASQSVSLAGPGGRTGAAMLNARRSPATGEVRWGVVFDQGIDAADPGWRSAADSALAQLRSQLGI